MYRLGLLWIKCTLSMLFSPRIHWGCTNTVQECNVSQQPFSYKATFIVRIQIQEGQSSPPKKETGRNSVFTSRWKLLMEHFNCLHWVVIKYCVVKCGSEPGSRSTALLVNIILRWTHCCGCMTFWCGSGSGSADPCLWLKDPDHSIFIVDLQDANQKIIFWTNFFCKLLFEGAFT